MKTKFTKALSLVLAFALILGLLPVGAVARAEEPADLEPQAIEQAEEAAEEATEATELETEPEATAPEITDEAEAPEPTEETVSEEATEAVPSDTEAAPKPEEETTPAEEAPEETVLIAPIKAAAQVAAAAATGHLNVWSSYVINGDVRFDFENAYFWGVERLDLDGTAVYCIEPSIRTTSQTYSQYNTEYARKKLGDKKFEAASLALAYGWPNTSYANQNSGYETLLSNSAIWQETEKWAATQTIFWEFVWGYRQTSWPYTCTNKALYNKCSTETWGRTWDTYIYVYKQIEQKLAKHNQIPSFTSRTPSTAPTYEMTYDEAGGNYKLTLQDSNGILASYSLDNSISGVTFSRSGNTLTITATPEAIEQLRDGVSCRLSSSTILEIDPDKVTAVWGKPGQQTVVTPIRGTVDPARAYFKLEAEAMGTAKVVKKNSVSGGRVEGFTFQLMDPNGTIYETQKTDADGNITFTTNLTIGKPYTIHEVPEDGYIPQRDQYITAKQGDNVVTFTNTAYGHAKVIKISDNGKLDGFEFSLWQGNTKLETVSTGATGIAVFTTNLTPGTQYTMKETPVRGYEVQPDQTFTAQAGKTTEITFSNKTVNTVQVIKTSEDGVVAGRTFRLLDENQQELEVQTTDEGGKAVFATKLTLGQTYWIAEDDVPGYAHKEAKSFVATNGVNEISFQNVLKKWTLTVTKKDSATGSAQGDAKLGGAVYGIYDGETLVDTYTTDNSGKFTTKAYVCGDNWSVKEITPPTGYTLNTKSCHIGAEEGNYTLELNSVAMDATDSVILGKVEILKTTQEGLDKHEIAEDGAQFQVYLTSAGSYNNAKETERDILVTDKDGHATSKALPYGTYTVHQVSGWEGRDFVADFTVTISENGKTYTYALLNPTQYYPLRVVKVDSETGKPVAYAQAGFKLYSPDGKQIKMTINGYTIDTFYTDNTGSFITEIDAESFCNEKSAIFIIMPEENPNTFFMISLIIQQLYREILAVADENGGKLKNRCVFFCDEFGTLPKIESAEMMFSASRSRRLQIVPIIQSFSQLDKNYGKEGSEIIVDNTQVTLFGGFAPNSSSADILSKALGSRTVMSGSVSRSKNDPSQSLQMMERPLLTPDELKSLPKGDFVVMKTGVHPMRVHLKLFFQWGIQFDEAHPYSVPEHGNRHVRYAEKKELLDGIMKKYHSEKAADSQDSGKAASPGGQAQRLVESNNPKQMPSAKPTKKKSGGTGVNPVPPSRRHTPKFPTQEASANEQT